jgi:hypothetical protein
VPFDGLAHEGCDRPLLAPREDLEIRLNRSRR